MQRCAWYETSRDAGRFRFGGFCGSTITWNSSWYEKDRSRTFMDDKVDWSLWWVLTAGWHSWRHDSRMTRWVWESEIPWHGNLSPHWELGWHRTEWRRRVGWDEMEKLSVGDLLQILEVASGENACMHFWRHCGTELVNAIGGELGFEKIIIFYME